MTTFEIVTLVSGTALAAVIGTLTASRDQTDSLRIARLEKKLDLLLTQSGLPTNVSFPASSEVVELVRRGRKIEAIKLYREQNSGVGLKEAKDAVDQIEQVAVR